MNRRAWLAFATLALAAGAIGCGGDDAATWLAESRQAHVRADAALRDGDVQGAERALTEAFERAVPSALASEDSRVVRQDLAYRLASLALDDDRADAARAWADRGLALGTASDVFTANLHVVRGQAREALGDAVGAAGDYHEALLVNEALLDRVLEEER